MKQTFKLYKSLNSNRYYEKNHGASWKHSLASLVRFLFTFLSLLLEEHVLFYVSNWGFHLHDSEKTNKTSQKYWLAKRSIHFIHLHLSSKVKNLWLQGKDVLSPCTTSLLIGHWNTHLKYLRYARVNQIWHDYHNYNLQTG